MCPGGHFSKDPVTYWAQKAILETMICFCEKLLFWYFSDEKKSKINNCQVSKLETRSYWRYKGIHVTQKVSRRSRNRPLECNSYMKNDPRQDHYFSLEWFSQTWRLSILSALSFCIWIIFCRNSFSFSQCSALSSVILSYERTTVRSI